MAPTPVEDPLPEPTDIPEMPKSWSTAAIVGASIFAFLALAISITLMAFCLHKRKQRNELPPEQRPRSYHPFRIEGKDKTDNSDRSGLLANAAPSPEEDKTSMFSRERGSSVSLYVDTSFTDKRSSVDTVSLVPLHVTPAEEPGNPMENRNTSSVGSGVSSIGRDSTSRYSTGTRGTRGSFSLSPLPTEEDGDLGARTTTRPRSTSTTSTRYYERTPTDTTPQVPKIVHTVSD